MANYQQAISEVTQRFQSPIWQRLDTHLKQMSPEQMAFVNADEQCIQKKKELNEVFVEWLFARHRDEFAEVSQFKPMVEDYANSIIETSHNYLAKQAQINQEYESMKAELEELRKFKESMER